MIGVFCWAHPEDTSDEIDEATLNNIKKCFKKFSFLVYPYKCASDRSPENKSMQRLSQAKDKGERDMFLTKWKKERGFYISSAF